MGSTQMRSETASKASIAHRFDMKLEVIAIPVADIERAKRFYSDLGWRLDGDFVAGDSFRGRTVHAARLIVLDPFRQRSYAGCAGFGSRTLWSCRTSRLRAPS